AGAVVAMRRSRHGRSDDLEAVRVGVARIDGDGVEAGNARPALDGGHDAPMSVSWVVADLGLRLDASAEQAADDALVDESIADPLPALGVQLGYARRGAGAAGTAVDRLVAVEHGVARVGFRLGRL